MSAYSIIISSSFHKPGLISTSSSSVFVGHDPASNNIVVAHEGTLSDNPFSIAIDADFALAPLNTTFFPNSPAGIETHAGFGETFAITANEILDTVQGALSANKVSSLSASSTPA